MLIKLQDGVNFDKSTLGNKAYNLSQLFSANFNVAEGFILTAHAYDIFKKHNKHFFDDEENKVSLPEDLKNIINSELETINDTTVYFVVRSSGVNEDGIQFSYAGQYKTIIGAKNSSGVLNAVVDCWLNYIMSYKKREERIEAPPMPLLIQRLVSPFVSGVMFTAHPILNSLDETIIESNYGLCSSIVDGEFAVDRFVINKINGNITEDVAYKEYYYSFVTQSGLTKTRCTNTQGASASLTRSQIKNIFNLGEKITSLFRCPQDIEWGICTLDNKKTKIYIFQSRSITTMNKTVNYYSNIEEDIAKMLK